MWQMTVVLVQVHQWTWHWWVLVWLGADLGSGALAAWGLQLTFCENGLCIKWGNGYDMMLTDTGEHEMQLTHMGWHGERSCDGWGI